MLANQNRGTRVQLHFGPMSEQLQIVRALQSFWKLCLTKQAAATSDFSASTSRYATQPSNFSKDGNHVAGGVWLNMTCASDTSTTAHRSVGTPPSTTAEWEGFEQFQHCGEILAYMSHERKHCGGPSGECTSARVHTTTD